MRHLCTAAVFVLLTSAAASAQVDLTGSWQAVFHEDQPERIPGPALGDYLGLPINDSARAFAEAWDASRLTVPEHQCRAHSSPYILRGPANSSGALSLWTAVPIPHRTPSTRGWGFPPAPGAATRSS